MRTIKFNNEADVGAIARRAYDLQGSHAEEQVRRAERALLEANPHLESMKGLKRGTIILVPDIAGVRTSRRVQPLAAPAGSELEELTGAVEQLEGIVAEALKQDSEDAKTAAQVAGSGKLRNRVKKEAPELIARLDEVAEKAKAASKEADAKGKRFDQAFRAARQDLSELKKRLA